MVIMVITNANVYVYHTDNMTDDDNMIMMVMAIMIVTTMTK